MIDKPVMYNEDVIERLVEWGEYPGIPQAQADKMLRSLYQFAVYAEADRMTVLIEAKPEAGRFWKLRAIKNLLKGCAEQDENSFDFQDASIKTPAAAFAHMTKLGLQWDKSYQDRIDPSLTKQLEALAAKPVKASPKNKAPKL